MRLQEKVDSTRLESLKDVEPQLMLDDLEQISDTSTVTLTDLYKRWERQNWSAYDLDFSQDAADWEALTDDVKQRMLWVMSMFYHGEDAVTATLGPWVENSPNNETQIFLSTQLADEARHAVFFDRFYTDVVRATSGQMAGRLKWAHPYVNEAFDEFFRVRLPQISKEVADRPGDPVTFARGVTFYHFITEGLLAVPGQRYLLEYCRDNDILPAFRSGFTAVARDESRHVGAGVRIIQDLIKRDPDVVRGVQEIVKESIPLASEIFQPPNADFTYFSILGYDIAQLFRFAVNSLQKRLRASGVPFPRIGPMRLKEVNTKPVIPDRPLTAIQQILAPIRDEIQTASVFQGMPVAFNATAAEGISAHYQFDIVGEGGGTWTVFIDNGTCEIKEGPAPSVPDQRMEMSVDTWISMSVGDMIGTEAFMLGKVTLEGNILTGIRFDDFFTPN